MRAGPRSHHFPKGTRMYTLVLMSAMAGAPDAAGFGGRSGFLGTSCYGSCYGASCVGASYAWSGCAGFSCAGCGGYVAPLFPRLAAAFHGFNHRLQYAFAPPGTYATCYGCGSGCTGCTGCLGSCTGCLGSCSGCSGCFGSCTGCFGSCTGCFGGVYYGSAVYGGCYGTSCVGCFGGGCVGLPLAGLPVELPAAPGIPVGVPEVPTHVAMKPAGEPTSASLLVSLPPAAKLYVDGQLVPGDGPTRRFHTPPLAAGQSFFYELRAEVLVGGKTETEDAKVVIRSGDTRAVGFPKLLAAVSGVSPSLAAR